MLKNIYIVLLLIVSNAYSQDTYEIDTKYPVHDVMPYLQIIEDINDNLTPEEVLKTKFENFISGDEVPRFLDIGKVYWGKLSIQSKDSLKGWTLQFEDKMIGPPAWTKSNGKIDVFGFINGQQIFHKKTGVEYPKSERDVKAHWVLNQIDLSDLPLNKPINLIIRAEGNQIGFPAYFNLSVRSPKKAYYHQAYSFNRSFNLFMFGASFIIFLYNLLQFIYTKDKVYLWFSVWLFFITLTQAMTVGLLIGSFTQFRYPVWALIANGVFYTFWFFGRAFIGSKQKFPKLDKAMKGLAIFLLAEIIIVVLYVVIFNPQTYNTGVGVHYIVLAAYTALSLVLSIILVAQKDLFARYFGIGSIVGSIFLILGTLWAMRIISLIPNTGDPFSHALLLQIIIYSFGIAYRRQVLNNKVQQERLEAQQNFAEMQRIKDLDDVKTRFFANISHEFRTPLALISGPLKQAFTKDNSNDDKVVLDSKSYDIIQNNATRLQGLVDQLLDLSKLESGKVHLSLKQGDLIKFLRSIVFSFESMAERQNISLKTSFPVEIDTAFYDRDKLEKIVSNILSNAFKYTPDNGTVTIMVDYKEGYLKIEVTDTGKGISKEDVKRIFDRFYRVEGSEEKGSGIGLALTKELVDLHNGTINVDSTIGEGTTFKIRLPITLENLPESISLLSESTKPEVIKTSKVAPKISEEVIDIANNSTKDLPVVLVVEDNKDLRYFITEIVKEHYKVLTAEDGMQGERMAFEHIPDIIISDVMMPKKDGYEMCHSIKLNSKTSHIPIIMLTAKAGQENKIEGLTQGADAYLTKPFDAQELLIRMQNLIEARKKLWEHFKALDMLLVDNINVTSIDDQFLQKVFKCIKDNLDNEQFSVEDIAKEVGFSRSQLHRKLKALSDRSVNQLIVEVRLNEAKRMLEQKAGSVSEIAYSVGYSNLSYFTKTFKEKFGKLPSKI